MVPKVLQLDPRDNVLIALSDLKQGESIEHHHNQYTLISNIPAKQKFVTKDLKVGDRVTMYGVMVGKTSQRVRRGELLTTANIHHQAAAYHQKSGESRWSSPDVSSYKHRRFHGYVRADGQVGTRNYWLVVPLVFCENRNILNLKQAFEEELGFARPQLYRKQVTQLVEMYRQGKAATPALDQLSEDGQTETNRVFPNVDGIKFLLHEGGCGGTREDSTNLCGLIAGYIHHPNVAGATVLSLGCQHSQTA